MPRTGGQNPARDSIAVVVPDIYHDVEPQAAVAPSFAHGLVAPCTPRERDEAIFERYLAGLGEAGWRPTRALAAWAEGGGRPLEELLYEPLRLMAYLLDLLDEARELAAHL